MKSIITIFALALTISFANAQERGNRMQRSPEDMAKAQTERLTKELSLTQAQQDSIHKYILSTSKEQQTIFQQAGDDRQGAMKAMQALREKQTVKIKSFLNEEQAKKYEELAKQRPGFGGQGGERRGQGPNN